MNVTREQIVAIVQVAQEMMRNPAMPTTICILSEEGHTHLRSPELHVMMTDECFEAFGNLPAGSFEPRLYVAEPPQPVRKPQPPFWANDWRRGREGRGR